MEAPANFEKSSHSRTARRSPLAGIVAGAVHLTPISELSPLRRLAFCVCLTSRQPLLGRIASAG